ncbi:MAG TPA: pseudouridine synthase [Polyangiaceae bacterium]|nr:pseudouridine synthase [Polyangiaceae bacterium]
MTLAPPLLYLSAALVAVDKPSGLAVHRGQSRDPVHALQLVRDSVAAYVYPVHRLDRATSGVLLFALSADAARAVGAAFEAGSVEKRYVALVRGNPPERALVDHPLSQEDDKPPQDARTEVVTLARYGRYALVEAIPYTGRTHQIRRHLKHLSCPIIGDVRYGKGEHNRYFRTEFGLHRLALHAASLTLTDPATRERVTIRAPLPAELERTLAALGAGREPA